MKDIIIHIIEGIVTSGFVCALLLILYALINYKNLKNNNAFTNKTANILVILSVILGFSFVSMKYYWGNNTIGSFFSKATYNTQYYVHMFPDDSKSKNYLVPADLLVDEDGLYLQKVYWPNGGTTSFDDIENNPSRFYNDKRLYIKDDEGRWWTVVLENKIK